MAKKNTYTESIQEVETILNQIESGDMDVDELSANIKRATQLLSTCKKKLRSTETEIEELFKQMDE